MEKKLTGFPANVELINRDKKPVINFCLSQDKPLQGNFDGDGKGDIAVWSPSNGVWYILKSSDQAFFSVQFGQTGDTAIPSIFVP